MKSLLLTRDAVATAPLWNTHHDQPEGRRSAMIALLNQQLADLLDLGLQAKQAHWNVKGPHFAALHTLFDEVAAGVAASADELAERAVRQRRPEASDSRRRCPTSSTSPRRDRR